MAKDKESFKAGWAAAKYQMGFDPLLNSEETRDQAMEDWYQSDPPTAKKTPRKKAAKKK